MNPLNVLRETGRVVELINDVDVLINPPPPNDWIKRLKKVKPEIVAALKSEQRKPSITERLDKICQGLDIDPEIVGTELSDEDIKAWQSGEITDKSITAFVEALIQRRGMEQGIRPRHYSWSAHCVQCGDVWLWTGGYFDGCPWCANRINNRPIPRPNATTCGSCKHFTRNNHPHIGACSKGVKGSPSGWWDDDKHCCKWYLPARNKR